MKLCSWNVLAPELMLYFWRSSYGFPLLRDSKAYDEVLKQRMNNIISHLKRELPDILFLQEVTDKKYNILNNLTIQEYIANALQMTVLSQAFKESLFTVSYPPTEQNISNPDRTMDSGVATLVRKSMASKSKSIVTSSAFPKSSLFKSGVGSPFTVDIINSSLYSSLFIINTHIRMQFPHIVQSVEETYSRIKQYLSPTQLTNAVFAGDFNAHTLVAAKELLKSDINKEMHDMLGNELTDDHLFVGRKLLNKPMKIGIGKDVPLLEIDVNHPTTGLRWTKASTTYRVSDYNANLLKSKKITTDHPYVCLTVDLESSKPLYAVQSSF